MEKVGILMYLNCLLLITLSASHLNAQEKGKNTISLHCGMGTNSRQDLVFSPFRHNDLTFLQVGLQYERHENLYHKVGLEFSQYNPTLEDSYVYYEDEKKFNTPPHSFTFVSLGYSLAKPILEKGKTVWLIGGSLQADVQSLNYAYGRFSNFGYFANFGIGFYSAYHQQISKKMKLLASIKMPLISWNARSPYLVNDDDFIENTASHNNLKIFGEFVRDGKLVSLNKLQSFETCVQFSYQHSPRWNLGFRHQLAFFHSRLPRNLFSLESKISLSAGFNF